MSNLSSIVINSIMLKFNFIKPINNIPLLLILDIISFYVIIFFYTLNMYRILICASEIITILVLATYLRMQTRYGIVGHQTLGFYVIKYTTFVLQGKRFKIVQRH